MGRQKAWLTLEGRSVIEWLIATLKAHYDPVRIIANEPASFARLGLPLQSDLRPGSGPLGGIHAALATACREVVFIAACDLPFLNPSLLNGLARLLPGHDAVVPWQEGRPLPVSAFYSVRCLSAVEARLDQGKLAAAGFLDDIDVRWVREQELEALDPDGVAFFNLNTPEDYQTAQEIVANRPSTFPS
jgi:molybdopterin-guanine dinucleotide biosynthesis protein A